MRDNKKLMKTKLKNESGKHKKTRTVSEINGDFHRKLLNFPTPVYLTPPLKGFPLEFGIGTRGPKSLNDGATRWLKKF